MFLPEYDLYVLHLYGLVLFFFASLVSVKFLSLVKLNHIFHVVSYSTCYISAYFNTTLLNILMLLDQHLLICMCNEI